jgi:hypothetical protein
VLCGNKGCTFGGQACFIHIMNIKNSRGGQAVAETIEGSRTFAEPKEWARYDKILRKPTIEEIIAELQSTIDAWHGDGEEEELWSQKCHWEAIRLIRGMKEVTA